MRIMRYENKLVDFEVPINVGEKQKTTFVNFMNGLFTGKVITKEVKEPERVMHRGKITARKWAAEDYFIILTVSDNEKAAHQLKRSPMSVRMKRGYFVPAFMSWAQKNGKFYQDKEAIKEYLESQNE